MNNFQRNTCSISGVEVSDVQNHYDSYYLEISYLRESQKAPRNLKIWI